MFCILCQQVKKKMKLTYRTKGWKHAFSITKMQIFPKTKGFCNKRGLFRKKSLFSIKTAFTFLEKTQIPNIGFYKKTNFFEKPILPSILR